MKKLIISWLIVCILTWCSSQSKLIDAIVEGDRQHSQKDSPLSALDVQQRISTSGHLDLSNLDLWNIPDICKLLRSVDLSRIVSLDLSNNNIQEVSWLSCLPSLKELNLSDNQIDSLVWFPLMKNLEKLDLARNKLKDLSWIDILKGIIELQLWENFLEDLTWIDQLQQLKKLWVELNKIKDIDVLQYLDQLKEVNAKYNNIKDTAQEWAEKIPGISF